VRVGISVGVCVCVCVGVGVGDEQELVLDELFNWVERMTKGKDEDKVGKESKKNEIVEVILHLKKKLRMGSV